jgi:hypothetical protein
MLHVVGLLWSTNLDYAFNDLRIKLTLLVIVLIFTVKPVNDQRKYIIPLGLFIATLVFTSLVNILSYNGIIGHREILDIRDLSLFGSHIRYGILIAIGAAICLHYLKTLKNSSKWIFLPILLWFCFYTYYSQILSGTIALIIVFAVFLVLLAYIRSRTIGMLTTATLFILICVPVFLILQDSKVKPVQIDPASLPATTLSGNGYTHDLDQESFIDGKPVFANLCEPEIKKEWEKHSVIPYDSLDRKGQSLRTTLIRYMTSKDLKKDSADFSKLSDKDIQFVENGVANYNETKHGLIARWEGLKFELFHATDPNGHTLRQRLEYWNAAVSIIQKNWLMGVGTGDVQDAFDREYELTESRLLPENRLRAHNSYLTSWVSFGILGFLSFMLMNLLFLKKHLNMKGFLPLMFILVAMVTFLFEDTLETQTGVSFFAFFYGFFIHGPEEN